MRNCGFPTSRSHDITRYTFQRSNVRLVFVSLRYNRQVCLRLICMHKFKFWTTNLHEKPLWWLRPDVLNYSVNMHQISTNWVCLDFGQLVQPNNNNNNEINGLMVDWSTHQSFKDLISLSSSELNVVFDQAFKAVWWWKPTIYTFMQRVNLICPPNWITSKIESWLLSQ